MKNKFQNLLLASRQWRDNSTCKFQSQMTVRLRATLLKLGSHNPLLTRDCSTYQFPRTSFRKLLFHNNRGIALITVILIVGILVAVVIELNRSSRADIYDAANLSDGIKLTYIAKSGFYGAAALLVNHQNSYDTLRDDWSKADLLSAKSTALFPDGYFIATVEDEAGKIPLNKLVNGNEYNSNIKEILIRLLSEPEFGLDERKAVEIVDAIKDWIDGDEEVTGYGAESAYYSSLDPPYEAKNAPLDCIEELLMVKGITKEIFYGTKEKKGLAGYVTADSDGTININTAPTMVLRALSASISAELADRMDEYRRDEGNDLSNSQWYKQVPGMADVEISSGLITVRSNYFKIISTGKTKNMSQSISGVVKRSGQGVQIIKWRQD
jgi:general secretion pathway protein K